ncbi:BnaCnng37850D [Brassica napus]|uniref:BnaCnng37850D protein n=1 Tax=Brassica napus TaxID=3708 RepID=A0A078J854_BRANA|nr:BnaCnng37850D [Brassica napus]
MTRVRGSRSFSLSLFPVDVVLRLVSEVHAPSHSHSSRWTSSCKSCSFI